MNTIFMQVYKMSHFCIHLMGLGYYIIMLITNLSLTLQLISGRARSSNPSFSDFNTGTHNHHAVTSEYIKNFKYSQDELYKQPSIIMP